MVDADNFRILSSEEEAQYKFKFCQRCPFYECELIEEYTQFQVSHNKIHKSQAQRASELSTITLSDNVSNPRIVIQGTIVSIKNSDQNDTVNSLCYVVPDSLNGNIVSYNKSELRDGCIMSSRYVNQIECGRKRVSEGIGDHYKIETNYDGTIKENIEDRWEPIQPVFISAQTGQGKNFFIENTLIPYVRELNHKKHTKQKVLIISNRLALKQQIKNRLRENSDSDEEDRVVSYGEFADVITYQGLLFQEQHFRKKQKIVSSRYIYVICDEAHFFTSDAMFNPHTQKILSAIVRLFKDAVRVYMSATPYECLKHIKMCEEEFQSARNSGKTLHKHKGGTMVFYHFKRDYSYLNIKYYSAIEELYEIIIKSVSEKREKWLIFIDDIEKCKAIKARLEETAEKSASPLITKDGGSEIEKVFAVDATSKKDLAYMKMIKNEKLDEDTYVLISTSVLDNGVNLKSIDNIVVSDMEKVKCLQMVGRARVNGVDDYKTLYIKRFNESYVGKRIKGFEAQEDAYHHYRLAYSEIGQPYSGFDTYYFLEKYYSGSDKDWKNAKHWFGRPMKEPINLYLNKIATSLLDGLIPQYRFILNEMMEESQKGKEYIGQKYLEYQLSWFGKTYCVDNDITFADKEKAKKEFIAFLESYAESGEQIKDTSKNGSFRVEFTRLQDAAFGRKDPNKERNYSITKINSILEEENISYKVVGDSSYWVVEKYHWESEYT